MNRAIRSNPLLSNLRYEIRGDLQERANEMELLGHDIINVNVGNFGLFGFRTPEPIRLAIIESLGECEAYCHQKGTLAAREAIVDQQRKRGVRGVMAENVYVGNGVSELTDIVLRGLLADGDEVLVPSPDHPLWTAVIHLNRGRPVHYHCARDIGFQPDLRSIEELITERTRAIVLINPNNPTGAVYSREILQGIAAIAERNQLIVFADEIYDQIVYEDAEFVSIATLIEGTLCATFSGLSKVFRACGYRVGWVSFSGNIDVAREYLNAIDKLASLRLCSNVPGQSGVPAALSGDSGIAQLTSSEGRLFQSRQAIVDGVFRSRYLSVCAPKGAIYAFIGLKEGVLPHFDDEEFAWDMLHQKRVLLAPGTAFHVDYKTHFRITNLPPTEVLHEVFHRMEDLLDAYRAGQRSCSPPVLPVVSLSK